MDRWLQDLRHATRVLRKTPGFTLVILFTLAVGIGATTAMFSVVNAVLLQPLPFRDAARVVDITEQATSGPVPIAPANFVDWRRMARSFETMAVYAPRRSFNVATTGGEPERLIAAVTSSTFFDVLGTPPLLGRVFTATDAEPGHSSVVLSYAFWQRRFAGRPEAINSTLRLNGQPSVIVGVMPPGFNFPQDVEFWMAATHDLPSGGGPADPRTNRTGHYLSAVARLAPGVSIEQADAEMQTVAARLQALYPESNGNLGIAVTSLHEQLSGSSRTPLLVLSGAVLCMLLIVLANVANLLTARATVRARELAIRAAMGAGRRVLVRQLLTESLLLSLLGGGLGVLLAFWGVDLILALDPGEVPRVAPITVNGDAMAFALLVSIASGLVFGVLPAWQASRPSLQMTLQDATRGTTGGGRRHTARLGLVFAEVAMSLVLLVGAGLLVRSLIALMNEPLGFSPQGVLTMQVAPSGENYRSPRQLTAYWEQVLERVRAVPGVERAALTGSVPMTPGVTVLAFNVRGRPLLPLNQQPTVHFVDASPEYFELLEIPVVRGRAFTARDAIEQARVIVINEAMARREFPNADPLGQQFTFRDGPDGKPIWVEIVGVVGNVRQYRADEAPVPITYGLHTATPQRAFNLMVRSGDTARVAPSVRAAIQSVDGALPVGSVRTLSQVIGTSLAQRRFNATLLIVFAVIALLLAVAGIYGTVAFAVAQRTQEIGIRVALGATAREILALVLTDAFKPVAAGLVIGLGAALALAGTLERLVYGVSTTDPMTFAGLPLLLAAIAAVAALIPARRATRVDPMRALRQE